MPSRFITNLSQSFRRKQPGNQADPAGLDSRGSTARASRATFGIGTVIEQRYHLDAELGRGRMGIVYRAHDLPNNRDVAIKVINVGAANTLAREQFLREAQITAQLNHPHIVAVYETGTVDTGARTPSPFIAMEFIQGKPLSEMRGLTFAQIIDLGRQICDALEYAYGQGLVHRDLKPQNVLVEKRGFRYVAKLADFGLARPRGMPTCPPKVVSPTRSTTSRRKSSLDNPPRSRQTSMRLA
jgi:serine/threonine protein kinase